MKILGIGGLLGIVAGVVVAEWLGSQSDAAYYSVVAFCGIFGSAIAKVVTGKSSD